MNIRKLMAPLVGFGALSLAGCVAYPATYAGGPSCVGVIGIGTGCAYGAPPQPAPPPVTYVPQPVERPPFYAEAPYREHGEGEWGWRR